MLKRNTHNRRLNEQRVEQFAGAMKRGEWMDNGEPIARFSTEGVLLDGQTRLAAIVKSGITLKGYIIDGLAPESQYTMDIGQKRTFAQELHLEGFTSPNHVGALALAIWQWENEVWDQHKVGATRVQLRNIVDLNTDAILDAVKVQHRLQQKIRVTPTVAMLAYWLFSRIDQADADDFFDRLTHGTIEPSHPIGLLRERLIGWAQDRRGTRPNKIVTLAYFIKAWNFYRNGGRPAHLVVRLGGTMAEPYPMPV
jgi:hypothetical protein